MNASAARSISVTMSVRDDFVSTVTRTRSRPSRRSAAASRRHGRGQRRRSSARIGRSRRARPDATRRYRPPMPDPHGRVDLRSDTVTRPTPAMRRGHGRRRGGRRRVRRGPHRPARSRRPSPSASARSAALFVPSGTMANQIALRVLARAGHRSCCAGAGSTWSCERWVRPASTARGPARHRSTTPTARSTPRGRRAGSPTPARLGGRVGRVRREHPHAGSAAAPWPLERARGRGGGRAAGPPRRRPPLQRRGRHR